MIENKSKTHQMALLVAIGVMVLLIIRGNAEATYAKMEVSDSQNLTYNSTESRQNVIQTVLNFPGYLLNFFINPSSGQLQALVRDGFLLRNESDLVVARIGSEQRNLADELYMLTWQPQTSFVRREQLMHVHEHTAELPLPRYVNSSQPVVYLFNSHPHEMIGAPSLARYREGTVNILEFTHMIANVFADFRIPTLVEDRDVRDVLNQNGWHFNRSYQASRIFVEERIHQYPSLQFFFDIHRDGVPDHVARAMINGQSYARIMFVIAVENPNYDENMAMANRINDMLEARRPGITRGVFPFYPSAVIHQNFGQDLSPKMHLIEIGSAQSTVDEMIRSTQILAEVLAEYILMYLE